MSSTPSLKKLLISACLLGQPVRYDGASKPTHLALLDPLKQRDLLVIVCPEVLGGLGVPRLAAEIVGPNGGDGVLDGQARLITTGGEDITEAFIQGAQRTLKIAQSHQVTHAVLKAKSPSCGAHQIYDGQHQGKLIQGHGVTAALLRRHHITVLNEDELPDFIAALKLDEGDATT